MSSVRITRVTGAVAEAKPLGSVGLYEMVRVGARGLLGEVMRVEHETATLQVFEDTSGLALGEPVEPTGSALTVELGPGLLGGIFDGVARPLARLAEISGDFLAPGSTGATLDPERRWAFEPCVSPGTHVVAGDVLGTVREHGAFEHRVLLPPGCAGAIAELREGAFTVHEPIGRLADGQVLSLSHRWPVRAPRPIARRRSEDRPFVTGQRVFDFLFPVAEGGSVAVPGGFGTGKTVIEQSLAKYGDADVVIYVGCGERGNEMAEVLHEFPLLEDPRTGVPVMQRTVLIVNTSNMPVAAREASIYLGITVAEYYRDMGYRVAVLADSLSRWAEALREIGARLREMPGEEGYPTALPNRLGKVYERAGSVEVLGSPQRTGAVTFISAVSPPGGDFSEPVTQASLRVAGGLWALDADLAHQRQFPAVDWETSYSLYAREMAPWFDERLGLDWWELRRDTLELLQRERELREIASLVGPEALEDGDRLLLDAARIVRDVVLGQSAFEPNDAYSTLDKTHGLAVLARDLYREAGGALARGVPFDHIDLRPARHALAAAQTAAPEELDRKMIDVQQAVAMLRDLEAPQ